MRLHHLSLATGHTAVHRLDVLHPRRVAAYQALLPYGGSIPGLEAFSVYIRHDIITLLRAHTPVILCALGSGPDQAWNVLAAFQETFGPIRVRPPAGRWLGVVELPALGSLTPVEEYRLADFQRYLAAAMLLPRQRTAAI